MKAMAQRPMVDNYATPQEDNVNNESFLLYRSSIYRCLENSMMSTRLKFREVHFSRFDGQWSDGQRHGRGVQVGRHFSVLGTSSSVRVFEKVLLQQTRLFGSSCCCYSTESIAQRFGGSPYVRDVVSTARIFTSPMHAAPLFYRTHRWRRSSRTRIATSASGEKVHSEPETKKVTFRRQICGVLLELENPRR